MKTTILSSSDIKRKVLIFSMAPVPTTQYKTIEGGGIRVWGLAKGLQSNNCSVTIAIVDNYPQEIKDIDGISIINWNFSNLQSILHSNFDSVIVSYSFGHLAEKVAALMKKSTQLIVDLYVPIHVEVSARDSENVLNELNIYRDDCDRFNACLLRGDIFICAHKNQEIYYTGLLAALKRINPLTYRSKLILIVPLGVENRELNPIESITPQVMESLKPYVSQNKIFTILWFGGLYPWFDITKVIIAIQELYSEGFYLRLIIVGGKNPYNNNPDFVKQYIEVYEYCERNKLLDKLVYFKDWIDFEDRYYWYNLADVVLNYNKEGNENLYSWRTRIVDFINAELPMITNGMDYLSEYLLKNDAAIYGENSVTKIKDSLLHLIKDPNIKLSLKHNLTNIKRTLYWEKVVEELTEVIDIHALSPDRFQIITINNSTVRRRAVAKYIQLPKRVMSYIQKNGLKPLLHRLIQKFKTTLNILLGKKLKLPLIQRDRIIYVSHQMDKTGAPIVFKSLIIDFRTKYPDKEHILLTPYIDGQILQDLSAIGINVIIANDLRDMNSFIATFNIYNNDQFILNTAAIHNFFGNTFYDIMEKYDIPTVKWLIQEDNFDYFLGYNKELVKRLTQLIEKNKLEIFLPAKKILNNYQKQLGYKNLKHIITRIDVPNIHSLSRSTDIFTFVNAGTVGDGRKGQFAILSAFIKFHYKYFTANPEKYRNYCLKFIGLDEDYHSQQIEEITKELLPANTKIFHRLPRIKAYTEIQNSNCVICMSYFEAQPVFVLEGMVNGLLVLRNNCSGIDEQLIDGRNGLYNDDIETLCANIEILLNKQKTSDIQIQQMGEASKELSKPFLKANYADQMDKA